jgi:O-antigen ligase
MESVTTGESRAALATGPNGQGPINALGWKAPESKKASRATLAYRTLAIFSILYFARPEDFVPGLGFIPMQKILGGIAFLGLLVGLSSQRGRTKWPPELKVLVALFCWQCLTVPFASYKGGAFWWVWGKCSKAVIVALLVGLVVSSVQQLRQLIFIQAASVAAMTAFSVVVYRGGRMGGVLGGVFDNPNDLAMNIALNWPICLMFLISTRNPFKKALWGVGMLIMMRGLILTYSRSGFLALAVALLFSLWEFGIRGKRHYLFGIAAFCAIAVAIFVPGNYSDRLQSIFSNQVSAYGDSKQEREELLKESLRITATHPLLGIGPGNFGSYTRSWHVTHNTYTELSAEDGIPALIMFIAILVMAFRNLRRTRLSKLYQESAEVRLYTGGLWAGLAAYLMGAAFASTAYQLFPYFMVAYTTALYRLACLPAEEGGNKALPEQVQLVPIRA